jgi:hypothetical protein
MATEAQISANQNAQHSTGPKTESGKAASSQNNFKYGLTGSSFTVLHFEDQDEFDRLLCGLRYEHQPATMTESILVETMAQFFWLRKRALYLQDQCATDRAHRAFDARCAQSNEELTLEEQQKQLALFLRYQTTHDRAFHRALNDLLKLRAEKRKQEIGFESQKLKIAAESRRDSAEKRKQELHQLAHMLAEAKLTHQQILNSNLEFDACAAGASENRLQEAPKAA